MLNLSAQLATFRLLLWPETGSNLKLAKVGARRESLNKQLSVALDSKAFQQLPFRACRKPRQTSCCWQQTDVGCFCCAQFKVKFRHIKLPTARSGVTQAQNSSQNRTKVSESAQADTSGSFHFCQNSQNKTKHLTWKSAGRSRNIRFGTELIICSCILQLWLTSLRSATSKCSTRFWSLSRLSVNYNRSFSFINPTQMLTFCFIDFASQQFQFLNWFESPIKHSSISLWNLVRVGQKEGAAKFFGCSPTKFVCSSPVAGMRTVRKPDESWVWKIMFKPRRASGFQLRQ